MAALGSLLAMMMAVANPAAADQPEGFAADVPETEVIVGTEDSHDRMTVPVRIGEHGTFPFLIDTGSQRTVVSTELALRLALPPFDRRAIVGIAGKETAATAMVAEIGLGRRSFNDVLVLLFEGQHIGADGIVGIDGLQDQRVLIDFAANRMTVGNAKNQGGNRGFEIVVTGRRREGQLIVTDAEIDGVRTAVVIDTGANTSVGNRALQRALGQRGKLTQAVLLSVTGQQTVADLGIAEEVSVGDVNISNALIAFTDSPAFAALDLERRPALLLGMRELRLFKRVAIDFSRRKVLFDLPKDS